MAQRKPLFLDDGSAHQGFDELVADDIPALTYEAAGAVAAHTGDGTDAHDASAVSFVPAGGIAATDVQAALAELDTEKSGTAHTHSHASTTGQTTDDHHAQDHDHDGSPTQKLVQANTHETPDTDAGSGSLHHTIGAGASQAAAGNHSHAGLDFGEVGDITAEAFGDTALAGASGEVADASHRHAMPADPVTAHVAAGDPHTGYRLESADHSHATTGLQGGTVDHGALTGLSDDDHPMYATNTEFDDHSARHDAGGADALAIDAAQATGSLRTVTTSAAQAIGTAAAGNGTAAASSNHVHPTGAGTPSTQAFGDAAATGTGPAAAMTDHKHAMPANPVTAHEAAGDPHPGYVTTAEQVAYAQPLDSDLTAIAAIAPSNDDVIQRKAGAWTNRTLAQLIADLAALGTTFQPLDSDLTAIAALATTAFGRSILAAADPADATKYWDGSGAFSVPPGGSGLSHPQVLARGLGA